MIHPFHWLMKIQTIIAFFTSKPTLFDPSNVKLWLGREFELWIDIYYTQRSIKGGFPMEPEARACKRCWWEKVSEWCRFWAWAETYNSWPWRKNTKRMKLYWSLTNTHWTLSTHTHKELATEKQRTQGWSTHTQLPAKSHKPLSTQTGSQMKALAAHKSPVTARCLPCVCRVMDSPNQMMLEDTCDSKWSTIDSSGENDLQLTSFDYLPFSSPFFNWSPLNSLLSSKFGLLGRGKSGKWAVKTI